MQDIFQGKWLQDEMGKERLEDLSYYDADLTSNKGER